MPMAPRLLKTAGHADLSTVDANLGLVEAPVCMTQEADGATPSMAQVAAAAGGVAAIEPAAPGQEAGEAAIDADSHPPRYIMLPAATQVSQLLHFPLLVNLHCFTTMT